MQIYIGKEVFKKIEKKVTEGDEAQNWSEIKPYIEHAARYLADRHKKIIKKEYRDNGGSLIGWGSVEDNSLVDYYYYYIDYRGVKGTGQRIMSILQS